MPNKLSRYADGIMEAAWLVAVILVPVFFNVFSSRIFEPDKITWLRTLALVILAAWLVKLVAEGGLRWERLEPGDTPLKTFLKTPLVLPVLGLVAAYLIATLFSVAPSTSFWGSYQRLQGTYTTFSYLIVFGALAANLRRRAQIERLITTIILASLPVSLYGILQRYSRDPVPWGGNTTIRIAANMGNSIFVAAYLIMVFPLTFGRIFSSFRAILREETGLAGHIARATVYVFTASVQVIALYMSGSRGPALGWMAGLFFLALTMSLIFRKRWLTVSIVAAAILGGAFLLVFNLPSSPFEALKASPAIGRFGRLLDAESNTALVRKYIWEGAADLVQPHAPLEYPDGSLDRFNALRPLFGYGPEAMYVAYNPFYVPELGHVERRNASPDRSHNETWDSMVITGLFGLAVYLAIFTTIFYYGFKWLGLIPTRKRRLAFFGLYAAGGLLGAVGLSLIQGVEYAGVGLPFGILLGLITYLALAGIFPNFTVPKTAGEILRAITLLVLLSAILAHFVEINFGIAIAVTRLYFWVYAALLLLVGQVLPTHGQYEGVPEHMMVEPAAEREAAGRSSRKKGRSGRVRQGASEEHPGTGRGWQIAGLIVAVLLTTLGFDYISNSARSTSSLGTIWGSLTSLRAQGAGSSLALVGALGMTWLGASILANSEEQGPAPFKSWLASLLRALGLSAVVALVFWIWHAGALAGLVQSVAATLDQVIGQVQNYESILTRFYVYILLLVMVGGALLVDEWPRQTNRLGNLGWLLAALPLLAAFSFASYSNLRVIQADIAFKMADPFARPGQWPVAIAIYNRATQLAPAEDYYYLFLGRAYLEEARALADQNEQDRLIGQAESDLLKAQRLNPLNTDHTANLARLYSLWAAFVRDTPDRQKRAEKSAEYFGKAVTLSPNNARLWDEWAVLYLNVLQEPDAAYERLQHSLMVDPEYDWTLALLGDYYSRQAQAETDPSSQASHYQQAIKSYERALELASRSDRQTQYNYTLALAAIHTQMDDLPAAVAIYQNALLIAPNGAETYLVNETLARIYFQLNDLPSAISHAQLALEQAPDGQREQYQELLSQLQAMTTTQEQP
jgi:tetratricopeptide (TPR) repeat protein/O-antigen ligase